MNTSEIYTPSDKRLREIYENTKTIAVVGMSTNPDRAAYQVPLYLQTMNFHVIPVSPRGGEILGEPVRASLADIDTPVDVVDVFRPAEETPDIARQAVAIGAKVLWMQVGIVNDEARRIAEESGLTVVMGRCMGMTHAYLGLGPGPVQTDQ